MKKIKENSLEHNYKKINIDGIDFIIDINGSTEVFCYTPITAMKLDCNGNYEIYTTILDNELNPVIPLRKEIASLETLEQGGTKHDVILFDNHKCIYVNDDYCYLINLKEVEFEKVDNRYIPKNYILKFRGLYNTGTNIIIIYNETSSFLYNVDTEKKESKIYNFIKPTRNPEVYLAYHVVKNKYVYPLYAELKIEKGNVIHEGVVLMDDITLYPSKDILNSKTKLIKYCDSCYNDFVQNKGSSKCKTVQ